MSKKSVELIIREAVPKDAEPLLNFMEKVSNQTDYFVFNEKSMVISVEEEAQQLARIYESANNCLLLALDEDNLIGVASVHASNEEETKHIGHLGIVVEEEYQGMGLGTILMEELIEWAAVSGTIKRLQLEVQERNHRAIRLYEKLGFQLDGRMERGVYTNGEYHTVYLMSCMLGDV